MKNIKTNSLLLLFFGVYIVLVITMLVRVFVLSSKSPKVVKTPDIAQLETSVIEKTYDQIKKRDENRNPGRPDLSLFVFGKTEPFQ